MAMSPKVRNAHIRWLRAQVKEAEKDVSKVSATEAAHAAAMKRLAKHGAALSRAQEAKSGGTGKAKKKKGRKKGRR
jgi:hypothetical protein